MVTIHGFKLSLKLKRFLIDAAYFRACCVKDTAYLKFLHDLGVWYIMANTHSHRLPQGADELSPSLRYNLKRTSPTLGRPP